MEISKLLLRTASITLDAIFKASDADIRPHGVEKIPDEPVLFVVNHFTRLETTFLPYIIDKYTGKYPISLAHFSFFGGKFGKFLEKLGAVSTKHPDRDKIFLRSLLVGDYHSIIFPEGQMIKDKKIIEKGKYMVYNMGIRRPPHRGAARIALLSQLYREKIKKFYNDGDLNSLGRYKEHFNLTDEDVKSIIGKTTHIVPINITYFPIRARNNAIKKVLERFVGTLSDRFEEEIEVEGTMMMEGVDIDVNFGDPINMENYINKYSRIKKIKNNQKLYLFKEELKEDMPFKKADVDLMFDYMDSIYGMTTVNHDHIFAYILSMIPREKIEEMDFKNRAFLAIEKIKKLDLTNYHTSLNHKQFYLLTDDIHDKYESFIEAAISEKLITLKDGYIIKNKKSLKTPYQFHLIRKSNIIEVLKNEIEPLEAVVKTLKRTMLPLPALVRRKIRNHFIDLDQELFENDYKQYFISGESKPKNIGTPEYRSHFFNKGGLILVHGYMAAPEEMRVLADELHKKKYTVYVARLRGHGTAPEDLASVNWEKWYDSVSRAYIIMKNSVKKFSIIGFSTGAGLALLHASGRNKKFQSVISINAPLKLQNIGSKFSSAVVFWNNLLNKLHVEKGKMEYVTNEPENTHINYFRNPISGVKELGELMHIVEDHLGDISIPTLIIQGSDDPVVNPVSGLEIFNKIGTDKKELVRIQSSRHGIVRGKESEKVILQILEFLNETFKKNKDN